MLQCNNVVAKCAMRPSLNALYKFRKNNNGDLGSLGPCTFEPIDSFLQKPHHRTRKNLNGTVVIAIGDIHGDFLVLLAVLYIMDMISTEANWIGGDAHVVLTGDWMDRTGRGETDTSINPREEIDILQYLTALGKVGNVTIALGNHEIATVWLNSHKHYKIYQKSLQVAGWGGLQHKINLWRPGGLMAKYLAENCPLIVKVNSFLFMHGGLDIKTVWDYGSITFVNNVMREALLTPNSPLPPENIIEIAWNRDLSDNSITSIECGEMLKKVFEDLGLNWYTGGLVIGHTPQSNGIPHYCKGKVWRIDLKMSEAFGKGNAEPIGALRISFLNPKETQVERVHHYMQEKRNKYGSKTCIDFFINGEPQLHMYREIILAAKTN